MSSSPVMNKRILMAMIIMRDTVIDITTIVHATIVTEVDWRKHTLYMPNVQLPGHPA